MAEFCVCFWKSDHLRLVKMVLSIVFVFLSAVDFPIFLFSKINRSLSNIFKSMNRLLSLPTKIQIKNKKYKKSFKRWRFSVKMDSFFKNVLFVHFFYPKSQYFRWNCHFWWIIVIRLRKNVQIMLNFRPKKKFLIENALYFTMMTTNDSFLTKKTYLIWNRSFLIKMAIE